MTRRLRKIGLTAALLAAAGLACAFDLQGHRGARGLAPENTLPAFEAALRHGVTTLELDVGISRDGVVVIHHDLALNPDIARDAQGRWLQAPTPLIASLTWAELQRHDVGRLRPGSRLAAQFPQQQPADGTRIPRLAELFEWVRGRGDDRLRFDIETKIDPRQPQATAAPEDFVRALLAVVREAGMAGRVTIQSFDWRTLQWVQRLAPEIPTAYLSAQRPGFDTLAPAGEGGSPWTAGFDLRAHGSVPQAVKAAGGRIWSAHQDDLDAERIAQAHALGLQVLAWTVNEPAAMRRLIDAGVDGLITDRPDLARPLLVERGLLPR